jgi:hypothetical protein
VDEQEHAGGAGPVPPADGATAPLPEQARAGQQPGRGAAARQALTSRAAGWVVAAVLAGVIIGLLVEFAQSSPTVSVAPGGPARFSIGAAGLPPGAMGGPGIQRQIVIGPNGVQRQIVLPAGLPPGAVAVGPAGRPGQVVACPPGVATGPVRVFLPAVPAKVSWRFVQLPARAGAQIPASWAFPEMLPAMGATVHVQRVAGGAGFVVVPPGQLGTRPHIIAPGHLQITLPGRGIAVCPGGK